MQRGQDGNPASDAAVAVTPAGQQSAAPQAAATGSSSGPIRIAVIDPYPIFRTGVVQTIARHDGLWLVGEGATVADAQRIAHEFAPDILLIDICMPTDGKLLSTLAITNGRLGGKLVVLTALDDVVSVSEALATGVKGYILKGVSGIELVAAIKTIHAGLPYVTPDLASRLLTQTRGGALLPKREAKLQDALSYREKQMLDHVCKGLTNKEIAARLGLTVGTVKHYVGHLYKKMRVRNRVEAVERLAREAQQLGRA